MFVTGTLLQYKRMFMQGEHEVLLEFDVEPIRRWYLVRAGVAPITRLRGLIGKQVKVMLAGEMVVHLEPS